jgi:hypothetical protein
MMFFSISYDVSLVFIKEAQGNWAYNRSIAMSNAFYGSSYTT